MNYCLKIILKPTFAPAAVLGSWLSICRCATAAEPVIETRTLGNGLQLAAIQFPGSTNVSLFTFLPMGLASDGAGQAQWSHLVEHLVINSTLPNDLREANAETGPDSMRFDFYGTMANWKEGLAHHQHWLEGVPFAEASLAAEKPKVNSECDFTARNLATHKFALAAWSQGYRYGRKLVELKGDVLRASLRDIQRYRDERLVIPSMTTVCLVGGVDPETFFAEAEKQLGKIHSQARLPAKVKPHPGELELRWDLAARHLVLAWPMPEVFNEDCAALMLAAQSLTMQLFSDSELKAQTGMVLAGTDLGTPEGAFFYVSASLKKDATFEEVRKKLLARLGSLASGSTGPVPMSMLGQQLAFSFTHVLDPKMATAPPNMTAAMMEADLGLGFFANVHRFGPDREKLAGMLAQVSRTQIQQAAKKYLETDKASIAVIQPK